MTKHAKPQSIEAATRLLERYAAIAGSTALIEATRSAEIQRANFAADQELAPLLKEQQDLAAVLEPWWAANGNALAPKNRRSVQLGGCLLGCRKARAKLAHAFDSDDLAIAALATSRFAKHTLKLKQTLDRSATLKLLEVGGKTGASLQDLGFRIDEGKDEFFVSPVEQAGTIEA